MNIMFCGFFVVCGFWLVSRLLASWMQAPRSGIRGVPWDFRFLGMDLTLRVSPMR